jgi:hypothetical protein
VAELFVYQFQNYSWERIYVAAINKGFISIFSQNGQINLVFGLLKIIKEIYIKHINLSGRLATSFDPTGSSSGIHYEPLHQKLLTLLGSQSMLTNVK